MGGKRTCLLSLIAVIGLLQVSAWGQGNVLANGEFDDGLSGWYVGGTAGYEVSVVRDAGLSGDNAVLVDVTDAVAGDDIGLSQSIPNLVRGQTYPLSFIAMAEELRELTVLMEVYTPDRATWGWVLLSETVQLTQAPQLFTFNYLHTDDTLANRPAWTAAIRWVLKDSQTPMTGDDLNVKVWIDRINLGGQPLSFDPDLARNPHPMDEALDVRRDVVLSWTPGSSAETHDVYFGTVSSSVGNARRSSTMGVLVSRGQSATTYEVSGLLDLDQMYYWRVDEVGPWPGQTILKGDVWSFTAEPTAYPIEDVAARASHARSGSGPENTADGSGLNGADQHSTASADMWLASPGGNQTLWIEYEFDRVYKLYEMRIWNYNAQTAYGVRDVTVEYSQNGSSWTTLRDTQLNRASGTSSYAANTTIPFEGVTARYVRLIVHSNWGGGNSYGLSEVRFLRTPSRAHGPLPVDGARNMDLNAVLKWRPGRETLSHRVYLSVSAAAVADDIALVRTTTDNEYYPGRLDLGTVYYWKINEIDHSGVWDGDLWRFSTQEYMLIEDFEEYTDDIYAAETIWQAWIDGLDNPDNGGSIVGHDESPFAERTIVHTGDQSMPLAYDNSAWPYYSETSRTWGTPQNWTAGAADTLRLYFRGDPANASERLYVTLEDNAGRAKMVRHPDSDAAQAAGWQSWTIPFNEFAMAGVNITSISTMYIGLGNREGPTPGGAGLICIDAISIGSPVESWQ